MKGHSTAEDPRFIQQLVEGYIKDVVSGELDQATVQTGEYTITLWFNDDVEKQRAMDQLDIEARAGVVYVQIERNGLE